MRDHKLSIEPGEELHRECELRSWFVRAVSTDDVVELITDDCRLLLFAGQTVDRDDVVDGFRLVNRGDAAVTLHLQTASRASIGEKKNGGGDVGGGTVDQPARDAAAAAAASAAAAESEAAGASDTATAAAAAASNAIAATAEVDAELQELKSTEPFAQGLPDSGRLIAGGETYSPTAGGAYSDLSFRPRAGVVEELSQSKFIHNNDDNGGTRGAITEDVTSLLTAMGRTGSRARYGSEFWISRRRVLDPPTANSYPIVEGGITYRLTVSQQYVTGFDGWVTYAYWLRVLAGGVLVRKVSADTEISINGGEPAAGNVLPADGWHHVQVRNRTTIGYANSVAGLYAESGAEFVVGLPVFTRSKTVLPIHTAPVIYT